MKKILAWLMEDAHVPRIVFIIYGPVLVTPIYIVQNLANKP